MQQYGVWAGGIHWIGGWDIRIVLDFVTNLLWHLDKFILPKT